MLANSGVTYTKGMASFVGPNQVSVSRTSQEPEIYEGKNILIASGGAPEPGSFPGAELCMNSNDIFALEELPESLTVIGGGYIGIEIAQIMHALGVKVTVVIRSIPLRFVDREIVDMLIHQMKETGMEVKLHSPHASVTKSSLGNSFITHLESGEKIHSEKVLLAMGRPPSTKDIGLEKAGVETTKSGHVMVDEY